MRYAFMQEHRDQFKIEGMCEVMSVSRSGYYAWRKRIPSKRYRANTELIRQIREAHVSSRRLYGSPRITAELHEQGFRCGKNRVARLMKEEGIRAVVKRRRFRRTTDSRHDYALAANLLIDRHQSQSVWVADMTFVPTSEGWLYVSAVMDLKSRRVIGLSMGKQISQELASTAIRDAVVRQSPRTGLILHSDRGRQYASHAYQELLSAYGITPSMSRSGNCYDNAFMESFFGTLKKELVHGERYRTESLLRELYHMQTSCRTLDY